MARNHTTKIRKTSKERGFTLMELIVVIAIFGVMAALAVPTLLGQEPRMSVRSAARDIVSNMQMARINALRDHSTWAIQFDTDIACYRALSNDGGDDDWDDGDETVYKTVNLSNYRGVSYGTGHGARPNEPNPGSTDGVSFNSNRVVFNSDGTSVSGTVYVKTGDGDTFAIGLLSAAGRVKTWRHLGSGWEE